MRCPAQGLVPGKRALQGRRAIAATFSKPTVREAELHQSNPFGAVSRAAAMLLQIHGPGSAGEASDRADERFANIDFGGFAYWKNVEKLIRSRQQRGGV
jgi:hypothetical protein